MVQKFKTKNEKHVFDDERRRDSLHRKLKEYQSQKNLIKNALSNENNAKSNKIVFDDQDVDQNETCTKGTVNGDSSEVTTDRDTLNKPRLFEDSDSNNEENYEIHIKSQFEGKKGQKLLNLQSRYNNDDRFKLDERFYDDDDDDKGENEGNVGLKFESNEDNGEKTTQLKVLENVLGQSSAKNEKKSKKSFYEMVRFDAKNEEHIRMENNDEGGTMEGKDVKKKKKKKLDKEERRKRRKELAEKCESSEKACENDGKKFYRVTDELKLALKNRDSESNQFSLLEAFSRKLDDKVKKDEEVMETEEVDDNHLECDNFNGEEEELEKEDSHYGTNSNDLMPAEVGKVRGIKKEKFFIFEDDPRIEEGLKFINMKNSEEAEKVIENYDETRKGIREVLRLRWQKHRQKTNPFRKKIGGGKNQKRDFNKVIKRGTGRKH